MLLGAVLATGIFFSLPVENAHVQISMTLGVIIESTTVDSSTGEVTVNGTVTCTAPATGFLAVAIVQPIGSKKIIAGADSLNIQCTGTTQDFSLSLFADEGSFTPGKAGFEVSSEVCIGTDCTEALFQIPVRLTQSP